jgi:hypothetical protein
MKARKLRVQELLTQPDTPKSAKERIAASVPDPTELVRYTNAEELLKAWQITGLSGWLKQQLRPRTQPDEQKVGLKVPDSDSARN